jgi:hypothetical protein
MSDERDDNLLLLEMEQLTEQLKRLVSHTASIDQKLLIIADRMLRLCK